ncbi:MAG: hypothetical protein AAF368_04930, partial [Planctomycetota bacterium]
TNELVRVNAEGQLEEMDPDALEWFGDREKLEDFRKANKASTSDLQGVITLLREQYLPKYTRETLGSNKQRIQLMDSLLEKAEYERATGVWADIKSTTSPRTQGYLGDLFTKVDAGLERSTKAVEATIKEATGLDLAQPNPILWSTRPGLRSEAVWWAILGLLFGLLLRHRGLHTEDALVGERRFTVSDLLKVGLGLFLAWGLVYVLQHLKFSREPLAWIAVLGGFAIGWLIIPFLRDMIVAVQPEPAYAMESAPRATARPLAPILPLPTAEKKGDEEELEAALLEEATIRDTKALRKLRADRRRTLQVALSRLHPKSFGELHQIATDYTRNFVIAEVQEPKDLA